ncbi:MAG: hypothetical protein H7336_05890 [Bacteriovorax sp.]|nr:hypothetical protein [Bacteriovorax sp.]
MKEINIAIASSKSYINYARVMMGSVYAAHPDHKINLFVFYLNDEVAPFQKVLKSQSSHHNKANSVSFIKVDSELLKKVDNGKGWAIDLWCRWYALDFLSKDYDRVLLLGLDTYTKDDISDFYFQDMTGYYFAGTPDMNINNTDSSEWQNIKDDMDRVGFIDKKRYINGDVVLINLKETRSKLSFQEFLDLYSKNQFTCWDQDTINYCFNPYVKIQDSYKYNYFPNLNLANIKDSEKMKDATILHFAGGPKPWTIPPWDAKKFNGITEWWSVAKKVGYLNFKVYFHFARQEKRKLFKWIP